MYHPYYEFTEASAPAVTTATTLSKNPIDGLSDGDGLGTGHLDVPYTS